MYPVAYCKGESSRVSFNSILYGKIREKEVTYLMTRRLSRDQAVSLIIRGFMDVGILGLPEDLKTEITSIVNNSANAE